MKKQILFVIGLFLISNIINAQKKINYKNFVKILDSNKIYVKHGFFSEEGKVIDTLGNNLVKGNIVVESYNNGVITINNGKKNYLYDFNTKKPIPLGKYIRCSSFKNKIAFVIKEREISTQYGNKTKREIYAIDRKGKKLFKLPTNASSEFKLYGFFNEGLIYVPIIHYRGLSKYYTYSYFNIKGKEVIKLSEHFYNVSDFSNGLARVLVKTDEGPRYGYINTKGDLVIEAKFSEKPSYFSDSLAIVETRSHRFGYIDTKGNVVIKPKYFFTTGFYKGKAIIKTEKFEKYKMINKRGQTVKVFNNVYKFIYNKWGSEKKNVLIKEIIDSKIIKATLNVRDAPVLIDNNENVINNLKTLKIFSIYKGLMLYNDKGVMGVMNKKMKKLVEYDKNSF